MKTVANVIEEMLEMLNGPEAWCKHYLHSPDHKQHCLVGALNVATLGSPCYGYGTEHDVRVLWNSAIELLSDVANDTGFSPEGHGGVYNVVAFNNHPSTEYEDIRLFLKEALSRCSD